MNLKLFILTVLFTVACNSKTERELNNANIEISDYEKVSACYATDKYSFQQCCQKFNIDASTCDTWGTKRSGEIAEEMIRRQSQGN